MADSKITALTENTAPLTTDILPMVDDPAGTPATQKIQLATLFSNITLTAIPGSDHTASGIKITRAANENQAFGDVGYIASDGQVQLGDADAIATGKAIAMCCDATILANATGNYLIFGTARDDTWNWTVGGTVYLSLTGTTANTLTQTAPSALADVVKIIGIALSADVILFMPTPHTITRL